MVKTPTVRRRQLTSYNSVPRHGGHGPRARGLLLGLITALLVSGGLWAQSDGPQAASWVSLIQLIATPDRFEGKLVRLAGFAHFEFEGNALYFHREDYESSLLTNGVRLDVGWPVPDNYQGLSDMYVIVEGRFSSRGRGPLAKYAGEISEITRLERLPPRAEIDDQVRRQKE